MQGSNFVAQAVDIAASELISIATPGQGFLEFQFYFCFFYKKKKKKKILSNTSCTLFIVPVSEVQLNRAKESTKSAVLMNLESRVLPIFSFSQAYLIFGVVFTYELKAEPFLLKRRK